jgi:hypothetical protein
MAPKAGTTGKARKTKGELLLGTQRRAWHPGVKGNQLQPALPCQEFPMHKPLSTRHRRILLSASQFPFQVISQSRLAFFRHDL